MSSNSHRRYKYIFKKKKKAKARNKEETNKKKRFNCAWTSRSFIERRPVAEEPCRIGACRWNVHRSVSKQERWTGSEDACRPRTTETNRSGEVTGFDDDRLRGPRDRFLRKDIGLYRPFLLFRGFIGSLMGTGTPPLLLHHVNRIAVESDFLRVE